MRSSGSTSLMALELVGIFWMIFPMDVMQSVDGITLIFPVLRKHAPHFQGKTIDFVGDKFVLP